MEQISVEELSKQTNIREIYLFGSVARRESDEYSDIDVLIVIDDCDEQQYEYYKKSYAEMLEMPIEWISLYRIKKIKQMYKKGSYFLWHIKKEGVKLYSKENELEILLVTLPDYTGIENDLKEYQKIVEDVEEELKNAFISPDYELSVLASLVRNTCIAIDYMNGKFDFGRKSAIITCKNLFLNEVNFTLKEYDELYKYRLYQTGKLDFVQPGTKDMISKWIIHEKELLEIAWKGVKIDEEKKSETGVGENFNNGK